TRSTRSCTLTSDRAPVESMKVRPLKSTWNAPPCPSRALAAPRSKLGPLLISSSPLTYSVSVVPFQPNRNCSSSSAPLHERAESSSPVPEPPGPDFVGGGPPVPAGPQHWRQVAALSPLLQSSFDRASVLHGRTCAISVPAERTFRA